VVVSGPQRPQGYRRSSTVRSPLQADHGAQRQPADVRGTAMALVDQHGNSSGSAGDRERPFSDRLCQARQVRCKDMKPTTERIELRLPHSMSHPEAVQQHKARHGALASLSKGKRGHRGILTRRGDSSRPPTLRRTLAAGRRRRANPARLRLAS
jgi:hypothetical protein